MYVSQLMSEHFGKLKNISERRWVKVYALLKLVNKLHNIEREREIFNNNEFY